MEGNFVPPYPRPPRLRYSTSGTKAGASYYDGDSELDPHYMTVKKEEEATNAFMSDSMIFEEALKAESDPSIGSQADSLDRTARASLYGDMGI